MEVRKNHLEFCYHHFHTLMNTVTRIFVVCFFAACALEAFSRTADAGLVLGTDDASATAYDGNPSWPQDSDGSTSGDPVAFGAWMLSSGNGIAGHFVGLVAKGCQLIRSSLSTLRLLNCLETGESTSSMRRTTTCSIST